MLRRWHPTRAAAIRHWLLCVGVLVLLGIGGVFGGPHAWAWYQLRAGESALNGYHNDTAREHLTACLKVWPASVKAHLLAARAARRDGDFDKAEQHIKDAQGAEGGSSPEIAFEDALVRAAKGDLNDVEDFLRGKADKEPALAPLVWEALGEGYLRMQRILDAYSCLNQWLERDADDVQALYLRGSVSWHIKSFKHAVPDFRRVVELDPERIEARRRLAVGLLETHHLDEALEQLEFLIQREPDNADLMVYMARCQHGLGHPLKAKQILDDVLAEHPDHGPALRARGHLAWLAGQTADADRWLRAAIKQMPHDYQAHWELSQVLRQLPGKQAEARAEEELAEKLKKTLERLEQLSKSELTKKPHDPKLHYELGMLYTSLGQKEMGARWLSSALRENERFAPAHAALAEYYDSIGQSEQAKQHREWLEVLKAEDKSTDKPLKSN